VRYAGKIFPSLTAASIVTQLLTFVRVVRETATFVSNVRQDGIGLQGGHTDIENNDITNANIVLLG
jgi:hypothetical protein